VAWETVTGGFGESVISDNTRPWSGDHNMNPPEVPGMFFCNRPIDLDRPHITDIAPTVLDLFGVPIPGHMDGKSIMRGDKSLAGTQLDAQPKGAEVPQPV
jgi:bisphosphoglycerate-independent phosphoglycerate mutase (AlkP superfamily)